MEVVTAPEQALAVLLLPAHALGDWVPSPVPLRQGFFWYMTHLGQGIWLVPSLTPQLTSVNSAGRAKCRPTSEGLRQAYPGHAAEVSFKGRFYTELRFGSALPSSRFLGTALCQPSRATSATRCKRNGIIWRGEAQHGPNLDSAASKNVSERKKLGLGRAEAGGRCEAVMSELWVILLLNLRRSRRAAALPLPRPSPRLPQQSCLARAVFHSLVCLLS